MKTVSSGLQEVLQDVLQVKIVNNISANATKSRLIAAFCEEVGSDYKVLLLHTEVRWLSRGKVLINRLLQLREEAAIFIEKERNIKGIDMHNQLKSNDFLLKAAYLCDFFSEVNSLNLTLQPHGAWFWMTKLDAGLITPLPACDSGSAAVWGSKRINPRPQSCLCLPWSGWPSNDDDDDELCKEVVNGCIRHTTKLQPSNLKWNCLKD